MEFRKYFSFYSEPIPAEDVELLTENILDDLYASSPEADQLNIFFHLQNEYFFLKNTEKVSEMAYICYIISYYLLTASLMYSNASSSECDGVNAVNK